MIIKNEAIAHSRYAKQIGKTVSQLTEQERQTAFACFSITDKKLLAYKEYADALSKLPSKH